MSTSFGDANIFDAFARYIRWRKYRRNYYRAVRLEQEDRLRRAMHEAAQLIAVEETQIVLNRDEVRWLRRNSPDARARIRRHIEGGGVR